MAKPRVRFGLGCWDGLRSSTWLVSAGKESSVYLASRDIGHALKVSLHPRDPDDPGAEWRVAWTSEHVAAGQFPVGDDRVIDAWDSEDGRLPGGWLTEAFAVVLGRFSMGLHPIPEDAEGRAAYRRRLAKVTWIRDLPDVGEAWQVSVLVGRPRVHFTSPPGHRAMKAVPVGQLELPNGAEVWLMRHRIALPAPWQGKIAAQVQALCNTLGRPETPGVYRGHVLSKEGNGLRFFTEVAVTFGGQDADFEI